MNFGCVVSVAIYSALVWSYRWWLDGRLEGAAAWIVPCVAALVTIGGLGAIWNAWLTSKASRSVRSARDGMPPQDGKLSAVAGRVHALGQPLTTPFRGEQCVVYEYEIGRETRNNEGQTKREIDFSGVAMTPCRVQGTNGNVRLIGMPDLSAVESKISNGTIQQRRAMRWVKQTMWEDFKGMAALRGIGSMVRGLTDETDAFRHDWCMVDGIKCDWLSRDWTAGEDLSAQGEAKFFEENEADDDDEDEGEDEFENKRAEELQAGVRDNYEGTDGNYDDANNHIDDDDDDDIDPNRDKKIADVSNYWATPYEKCVPEGAEVVVVGRYDEMQGALVTRAANGGQALQVYFGDAASVADRLSGSKWRWLFGGLITLAIVHGALVGGMELYARAPKAKFAKIQDLRDAVQKSDIDAVEKMLDQGAPVDGDSSIGHTLLMDAIDGELAKLLVDRGANLEITDQYGKTALMYAAEYNRVDVLKVLIAAGANIDFKNPIYGDSALVEAREGLSQEAIALLLAAGAKDDVATATNGKAIDETHPAFVVVKGYVAAIHGEDAAKMKLVFPRLRKTEMSSKNFADWKGARPLEPAIVEGYVRGDDATLTVAGVTPGGYIVTWIFQLKLHDGGWVIVREHWQTK